MEVFRYIGDGSPASDETLSNVTINIADGNPFAPGSMSPFSGTGTTFNFKPTANDDGPPESGYPSTAPLHPSNIPGPTTLPAGSATLAGAFGGASVVGDWKLFLVDKFQPDHVSFTSWNLTLTVSLSSTSSTTSVSSSLNPSFTTSANNSVTLTATVSTVSSGSPTGTVAFTDGGVGIAGCGAKPLSSSGANSSTATCATTFSTEGFHSIVATYSGGGSIAGSSNSGSPLNQWVKNHSTLTAGNYCNPGGIGAPGSANTSPYPSIVNVGSDTTAIGNSVANLTVTLKGLSGQTGLGAGHFLLVSPGGTNNLDFLSTVGSSLSQPSVNVVIADGNPSAPANSQLGNATYQPTDDRNQADVFSQPLSPAPQVPGSINFAQPFGAANAFTLGQAFDGATANGDWALYLFDNGGTQSNIAVSGGWCLAFTVNSGSPTTTTITSPNPVLTGTSVTFTATVKSGGNPVNTGTVTFSENGVAPAGTVAGNNVVAVNGSGVANFTTSSLPEGDHKIVATYVDGGTFNTSSAFVIQREDNASSPTNLNVNPVTFCNNGAILIPGGSGGPLNIGEASPNPSNIFVSNLAGTINSVNVTLKNFHTLIPNFETSLLVGPAATNAATLDFFSATGASNSTISTGNYTFSDAGGGLVPQSNYSPGTYKPTSYTGADSFFASTSGFYTLPGGPFRYAATAGTQTLTSTYNGGDPNGTWSLYWNQLNHQDGSGADNGWCLQFTENAPDLSIASSHSPSHFRQGRAGDTISYTVTNNGPGSTGGTVQVVISAGSLPAGLTGTALSGSGWTCTLATLTCTNTTPMPSSAVFPTITLTVTSAANAPVSESVTGVVSGSLDNTPGNDSSTEVIVVDQVADLTIAKTHTGPFKQGDTAAANDTYTITVTNLAGHGPTINTTTVVDNLPTGLTASSISGTGWTCDLPTLTCTRSDALASGSAYPAISLVVTVAANAGTPLTNTAMVSGGGELNTANDTANDSTTIAQVADLTIAKAHTGNFTQGQVGANYTITVTNSGLGAASGTVTVVDTLPASGLTATALSGTGWACTLNTLTCTRSDALAPASSYPGITLTVTVANNAPSSVTNTAAVSGGGEVNTNNDTATDATTIVQAPDLTIAKSHSGNFTQGDVGDTFTITVGNAGLGPVVAGNTVTVVDTLPASGLTATAIGGTGWSCTLATLTCTRADALAVSASYPAITLTVTVANNAPASVTNSATASGGAEINTANDTATDPTTIVQVPDLTIAKSHTGSFTQGQVGALYTITVADAGPGPVIAGNTVKVVDTLPASMTATAIAGSGWTCVLGTLTCTRADALANGSSYPAITLTVTVAANAPASVTNSATVSGGGEINTANDTANNVTTIAAGPDLTITKAHSGNFTVGDTGDTYTITVANAGGSSSVGTVTVTDTLPASGLTATALAGTGWSCTLGTLTCTRADALANASSYPAIILTVNVAGNAPASVTNSATVSGGGDVNLANNTANDVTTVIQSPPPQVVSFSVLWGVQSYNVIGTPRNRLPWQINGIRVVFSKPITAGDVNSLTGLTTTAFSGLGTNTLTWTITPVALGLFPTMLAGSGPDALKDSNGAGLAGGAGFSQSLKILWGDFNDDGVVNSSDAVLVNAARSQPYNQFADMNGDGVVDLNDVRIVGQRGGTTLP